MAILGDYPRGIADPQHVRVFNELLKSIWHQECSLLNHPLANFREYTYTGSGTPLNVVKTLVTEYLNIEVSVPNLDDEVVANSGGLVLPTDRFMSAYDTNPSIFAVVEWPAGSGHEFNIRRKEYNAESGRLEMLIRSDNALKGVIYRRVTAQTFDGPSWKATNTNEDIVITVTRNEADMTERLLFAHSLASGDIVYWTLKSALVLGSGVAFVPAVGDSIIDVDVRGRREVYRIVGTLFESGEQFYRLLARRYEEATD